MKDIFNSASKIVFILLALTACSAFLLGVLQSQDFMVLAMAAFTFYFSNKGSGENSGKPYLGK